MKYSLYAFVFLLFCACKKDNIINTTISGKWRLTEVAFSSGGPMEVRPVDPDSATTMFFGGNGQFIITPAGVNGYDQYAVNGDTVTISSSRTASIYICKFEIVKGSLTLNPIMPMCIEGCYSKYINIK
ncbi:hypothetical protein GFS24_12925 [Chitinophaga sp. SYP-B3965]|uniref:hypothetical protein n=1 Tax=Chitinophaga sp. SYP-B3965 TaxID=2663120 RepID=UPI001299DEA5|nr:hypothetical protein [Chitinophaga sp. SYP-B3965]MRG46024.1 hypothetical protein [Chitinophaga sp. SYP-B3965]